MEKKISIIVPVYNIFDYLTECLDSIVFQLNDDMEFIIVDDGSTDGSSEICDKYALTYPNITVIHKENGGLSDARNEGIEVANAEYILFIDGDDYIVESSLSALYEHLDSFNSADLVFLNITKVFPNAAEVDMGEKFSNGKLAGKTKKAALRHISSRPKFPGSVCAKLIKASLIKENNIRFEKGLLSEDIDFMLCVLMHSGSFAYFDHPYYMYRQDRPGSITDRVGEKNLEALLQTTEKWMALSDHKFAENKIAIRSFLSYEYMVCIGLYGLILDKNIRKEIWPKLYKYKRLLYYGNIGKESIVRMLSFVFGIRITSIMLGTYLKSRKR